MNGEMFPAVGNLGNRGAHTRRKSEGLANGNLLA